MLLAAACTAYGAIGDPFHRALSNKAEDFVANTTGTIATKAVHTASDTASTVVEQLRRRAGHA
jgi:hypothetical protein